MSVELKVWVRLFGDCYWLLVYRELGRFHIFPDSPPSRLSTAPWRDLAEMGSFMLEFQSNGNVSVHQRFGTISFAPWLGVGHTPDRFAERYALNPLSRGEVLVPIRFDTNICKRRICLPKSRTQGEVRHDFFRSLAWRSVSS